MNIVIVIIVIIIVILIIVLIVYISTYTYNDDIQRNIEVNIEPDKRDYLELKTDVMKLNQKSQVYEAEIDQINEINARQTELIESNDITQINQQTQENSIVISELEIDVSNQGNSIDTLTTEISSISTDVTNISTQTTSIEQSLLDLSALIDINTESINTINTDIIDLYSKIDINTVDIADLQVNLNETSTLTNDNTMRIISLEAGLNTNNPFIINQQVDTVITSVQDILGGIFIQSPGVTNQTLTLPDESIDTMIKIINNSDFPCELTLLPRTTSVTLNSFKFMYVQFNSLIPSFIVLSGNI